MRSEKEDAAEEKESGIYATPLDKRQDRREKRWGRKVEVKKEEEEGSEELRRDLEREMVDHLREENERLHQEIQILRGQSGKAVRSSQKDDTDTSWEMYQSTPKANALKERRCTPGGTMVPMDTPPRDPTPPPMPPFPIDMRAYQPAGREGKCPRMKDERPWQPVQERRAGKGKQRYEVGPWTTYREDSQRNKAGGLWGYPGGLPEEEDRRQREVEEEEWWWTPPAGGGESVIVNSRPSVAPRMGPNDFAGFAECPLKLEVDDSTWPMEYWGKPVERMKEEVPTSPRRMKKVFEEARKEINERTYSQAEVEEMLRKAREERTKEKGIGSEEMLRSFPISLPKLPEPSVKNASLEAGDWLTQIRPLIADVCGASSSWWQMVEEKTEECYRRWLMAKPLDKLQVEPPTARSWQEVMKDWRIESRSCYSKRCLMASEENWWQLAKWMHQGYCSEYFEHTNQED